MSKVQAFICERTWVLSVEGTTVNLNDGWVFNDGTSEVSRSFKNIREAALGTAKKYVLDTLAPAKEPKAPKEPKAAKSSVKKIAPPVQESEDFNIPSFDDGNDYTYDDDVENIIADLLG